MAQVRGKGHRGFTLLETLLTVAILVILLAVSSVAVAERLDHLKIAELDAAARAIYMAAENRAVLLQGSGAAAGLLSAPGGGPLMLSSADPTHADRLAELLPEGTVDSALRKGTFWILYDPSARHVNEVFYTEKAADAAAGLSGYPASRADRVSYYRGDKASRLLVGRYGSGPADEIATRLLPTPGVDVSVENGSQLILTVRYTLPSGLPAGVTYTPSVTLEYPGESPGVTVTCDLWSNLRRMPAGNVHFSGGRAVYTWVLDSLDYTTPAGALVTQRFRDLLPGATVYFGWDFTVRASLTLSAPGYLDSSYGASATDNSLFDAGSGGENARLSNLRHLQNLDTVYSGAAKKQNAVQLCDIDCKNYVGNNRTELVHGYEFIPIENWDLKSYAGGGYSIQNLTVTPTSALTASTGGTGSPKKNAGLFFSVAEDFLFKKIRLVDSTVQCAVNESGGGHAGALVGAVAKALFSSCELENVTVKSPDAWSWSHVGGLVGYSWETVTFEDCRASGLTVRTSGGYAGGLLGGGNTANIQNCVVGNLSGGPLTVATRGDYAGGLVGNLERGTVKDSTVLNAGVTCTNAGSEAGGLVGRTTGGLALTSCTADRVTVVGLTSAGGLVGGAINVAVTGTADRPCQVKNSAVRADNNAGGLVGSSSGGSFTRCRVVDPQRVGNDGGTTANAGGLIGSLQGGAAGPVSLNHCSVYFTVSPGGSADYRVVANVAGGLVGFLGGLGSGSIENSFAAAPVDGTAYAGGLVGTLSGAAGTLAVTRSYACCYLRAGSNVGGLIGMKDATGSTLGLTDAYAAGYIDGKGTAMAGGLYSGWAEGASAVNTYAAIRYANAGLYGALPNIWPQAAGLKWKDPATVRINSYFLDHGEAYIFSDAANTVEIEYPDKRSYEEMKGVSLGAAFESKAGKSHPYDYDGVGRTDYPFPGLAGLDHYGDWPLP